jgi:hypothetical protein
MPKSCPPTENTINIDDRILRYVRVAQILWDEGYHPSFDNFQDRLMAEEGFEESLGFLFGAVVLGISDYHSPELRLLSLIGSSKPALSHLVVRVAQGAEILPRHSNAWTELPMSADFHHIDFFDWDHIDHRKFEFVDVVDGGGERFFVKRADASFHLVNEPGRADQRFLNEE